MSCSFIPAFLPPSSSFCPQPLRRRPLICHQSRTSFHTRLSQRNPCLHRPIFTTTVSSSSSPSSTPPETPSTEYSKNEFATRDMGGDISSSKSTPPSGFALSDATICSFQSFNDDETPFQVGGAYAIFDSSDTIVYMGYTKNVATKLSFHQSLQPKSCISFKVYVPSVPPELMSPDMLENVLEYWVREIGTVPKGNSVDRLLWEQDAKKSTDRKTSEQNFMNNEKTHVENTDDIPVRERTTSRRTSTRNKSPKYYSTDPFADAYRSSGPKYTSSSTQTSQSTSEMPATGWQPDKEDFVEVDVDPFDPFSASSRRKQTTRSSWTELEDSNNREDWYPIFLIMGFAGVVWLFGLLSNALPAATPSLGM